MVLLLGLAGWLIGSVNVCAQETKPHGDGQQRVVKQQQSSANLAPAVGCFIGAVGVYVYVLRVSGTRTSVGVGAGNSRP